MQGRAVGIGILLITAFILTSSQAYARLYGSILCKEDGYTCHRVKRGQSWTSLFPDSHDRDIAMRVNRMNTALYPGLVIAIPDDIEDSNVMDFAPFPKQIQAPGEKLIVVDTYIDAWGAYEPQGALVRWGPVSGGADWCRDIDEPCPTHSGSFRIFSLGSSGCISHKFPLPDGGAPMPYCMYFNNGQALHGEPNGLPGYNASHGCVRLYVNDAEWLRYDFVEGPSPDNNYRGTRILVRSDSSSETNSDTSRDVYNDRDEDNG